MRASTLPTTFTTTSAKSTSRASSHRLRTNASTTTTSVSASVPRRAARQSPGAQPKTVATACPISSSTEGADRAATAASAARIAAAAMRTPSIVRRFLRPGSAGKSNERPHVRTLATPGLRSPLSLVRLTPPRQAGQQPTWRGRRAHEVRAQLGRRWRLDSLVEASSVPTSALRPPRHLLRRRRLACDRRPRAPSGPGRVRASADGRRCRVCNVAIQTPASVARAPAASPRASSSSP
jgi:hypothetical protein